MAPTQHENRFREKPDIGTHSKQNRDPAIQRVIMEEHLGRYRDAPWGEILDFHLSAGFSHFKKRNRFSFRGVTQKHDRVLIMRDDQNSTRKSKHCRPTLTTISFSTETRHYGSSISAV
jgi:hypothetical protein